MTMTISIIDGRQLLTTQQLAAETGTSPGHWANLRSQDRSPIAYIVLGRSVRYKRADVDEYLAAHTVAVAA